MIIILVLIFRFFLYINIKTINKKLNTFFFFKYLCIGNLDSAIFIYSFVIIFMFTYTKTLNKKE